MMHISATPVRSGESIESVKSIGRGFTLIELLVVVAILSAASLLAFGIVTEDRAQIRYDDTRLRLQSLRRAILGQLGPVNPDVVGGFVADNGDLPSDLATLLRSGSLLAQGVQSPLFDPVPDAATCANNGGETPLSDSGAVLVKGHRGDYLGGLSFNGRFRDGWGNESSDSATDALNFGWSLEGASPSLTVASLGNDNAAGGSDFAADRALRITASDWQVPLQGWSVRLVARTDIPATQPLSVSLLVFRNTAAGGQWRRYSTPLSSVCLDGNGDGLVGGSACPQSSVTLSFTANCKAGDTSSGDTFVPQGRHLLLVTGHTGALWSSGDSPYWDTPINARQSVARIDAVAGMALPEARLELR